MEKAPPDASQYLTPSQTRVLLVRGSESITISRNSTSHLWESFLMRAFRPPIGWGLRALRGLVGHAGGQKPEPACMPDLWWSAKITLDIYTHVNMDSKRTAMLSMQDAFMK